MDSINDRLAEMSPLQRAVFALKETKAKLEELERKRSEPIAIVGMACRFPGQVNDPPSFWRLLTEGRDAIQEIPADRWDADAYYDPDPQKPGKMNTRWGGFLERLDEFDNHFFSISDREAEQMDPQHRMMLDLAWEALEDAGLPPNQLRGSQTGVYIGFSHSEYGMMLSSDLSKANAFVSTGTAHCIAANRVSYVFDFCGPSFVVDTACSSSLVTMHLACQAIRNGECEMALAGGVNVILSPLATVNLTKAGFSAPDGRIRSFDAAAGGYVRSEGAGLIALKPLSAARNDRDRIYAVIRGSAVNQNGSINGLTAPSRKAQEKVLREAYQQAGLSPAKVQYVETQGTGTPLGDAIEALALGTVIREGREEGDRCAIGSVKTNIGHLEAASGVASMMKVALSLQHGETPATLHFKTPNPDIPFDELPLRVQQELAPWPNSAEPKIAGVSAFGFGGSNAHVVLEEAPEMGEPEAASAMPGGCHLLPLSARTEAALQDVTRSYTDLLANEPPAWNDTCFTAAVRRDHHDCRIAVMAESPEKAAELLADFGNEETPANERVLHGRKPYGRDLKVAFVFSSDVEPWRKLTQAADAMPAGMVAAFEEIDEIVQQHAGWSLSSAINDAQIWLDDSRANTAVVAAQLAMAKWWRSAGVTPAVVLGEGAGELAAACEAGVLSRDDAIRMAVAADQNDLAGVVSDISTQKAKLPFVSTTDGMAHLGPDLSKSHWQLCLQEHGGRQRAIEHLRDDRQVDLCLEIGPAALAEELGPSVATLGEQGESSSVFRAAATLYVRGANLNWKQLAPADGRCIRLPTYPWQKQRLWATREEWLANAPSSKTVEQGDDAEPTEENAMQAFLRGQVEAEQVRTRPELNTPFEEPRTELEQALSKSWAEILRLDRVGVHDNFFELGGDSLQATILLNQLQEQLGEVVHVLVLFEAQTVDGLAAYLREYYPEVIRRQYPSEQVDSESGPGATAQPTAIRDEEVDLSRRMMEALAANKTFAPISGAKNPRAVIVLSPPRSGTTLLRVMLAGNPMLFSPPELELLGFDTMAARRDAYEGVAGLWLEGAVRALMETQGCTVEEARDVIARYENDGKTTRDFYSLLQDGLGDRMLVDKTPSYSGQLHVIERAEELFDEPLYIHLLRHPCGMIRSFVDYKMYKTYNTRYGVDMKMPFSPQQIGELVWTISHQNILRHLQNVPQDRQHRVQFEHMVRQPEDAMRGVCDFLALDYAADMIDPYKPKDGKMLDGVVPEGRMQGDQKFLVKHKSIDPSVADAWKEHLSSSFLGGPARRAAAEFGYDDLEPAEEKETLDDLFDDSDALVSPAGDVEDATELLQQLDHLSDEEVVAQLRKHLEGEAIDG